MLWWKSPGINHRDFQGSLLFKRKLGCKASHEKILGNILIAEDKVSTIVLTPERAFDSVLRKERITGVKENIGMK